MLLAMKADTFHWGSVITAMAMIQPVTAQVKLISCMPVFTMMEHVPPSLSGAGGGTLTFDSRSPVATPLLLLLRGVLVGVGGSHQITVEHSSMPFPVV